MAFFKRKRKFIAEEPPASARQPAAWADSSIYTSADFERYNPDLLMSNHGTTIYKKMMVDEQVKAVIKFRRDAITARDFSFHIPNRDKLTDDEAAERIRIIELLIQKFPGSFTDALNLVMTSMYNGFSLTEKVYDTVDIEGQAWWGIKGLYLRPFDSFSFKIDEHDQLLSLIQRSSDGREQELDIRKFIHHVQNPEVDRYYGQSELKEAYRAWFSKDVVIKLQNIWLERHAGGVRTAKGTNGYELRPGSPEYIQVQNVLETIQGGGTGIILPSNVEMEAQYPNNQVAFSAAIDKYDLMIGRSMLVPNLLGITPSGQTGSYAQSDTQLEAFLWTLDADTARLEETINEQLFKELGQFNWGDDNTPLIQFKPITEKKKYELVKAWADLVQKGSVTKSETDEAHIRKLLDMPEKEEEPVQPVQPINQPSIQPPMQPQESSPENNQAVEETIVGIPWQQYRMAVKRAESRVDFKVLDKRTLDVELDYVTQITDQTDIIVAGIWNQYFSGAKPQELKVDGRAKRHLNSSIKKALREHWRIGQDHAQKEVDKAKGETFAKNVDFNRLEMAMADYIDLEAFTIAGKLGNDIVSKIRQIIIDGERTDKTHAEIKTQIYEAAAADGYISNAAAEAELGAALETVNASSRVDTIIRTSGFKAVNEARFNYFTDPQMQGFVQALEYSAILDERTTSICEHLHGQVHDAKSDVWSEYRPPNHFNCRSILIPVTAVDDWTEDKKPTIEPQKGFQ